MLLDQSLKPYNSQFIQQKNPKTMQFLFDTCNIGLIRELDACFVKRKMEFASTPVGCEWVPGIALELLDLFNAKLQLHGFSNDETRDLLDFVCTS